RARDRACGAVQAADDGTCGAAARGGSASVVSVSEQDGIALLTLAHGKANALDIELCEALAARIEDLREAEARAVVITGQGSIFSAGVNLLRLGEGGASYVGRFLPALHRLYDVAFFFPKPMIAAINGHA